MEKIFHFLTNPEGLLFIQLEELAFFITLAYILYVEYARTHRLELKSKLVAVGAAISQIIVSASNLALIVFWGVKLNERLVPILTSTLTITTIIFLWHAFMFTSIKDIKKLNKYAIYIFSFIVFTFFMVLGIWNIIYKPGMHFEKSILYFFYEIFFIIVDIIIILTISKFKGKYKHRVIIGFAALLLVHIINIYGFILSITPTIKLIKTSLPIVVPVMFGSVMYKELLDHLVTLNASLKNALSEQGDLIMHIGEIDYKLNTIIDGFEQKIDEHINAENNTKDEDNKELLLSIKKDFKEIKNLLAEVDQKVFETMQNAIDYDEIML